MTAPNFLVAGAARSGTTALCDTLAQHPDVFMTNPKEVHFFAHAERPIRYTAPGDTESINRSMVTDPNAYLDLYRHGADYPMKGEGSVSTLYLPECSIPAIRRHAAPDVKIIAILREPVARAHSAYLYLLSRGFEDSASFEEALGKEDERRQLGYHHMWQLRGMSRYGTQIQAFSNAFGADFKVVILEEYKRTPEAHLEEVCRFLGIDSHFRFASDRETNRGGVPRNDLLIKLMSSMRRTPIARQLVRTATPHALRERVRSANLRRPPIAPHIEQQLRTEFADDVVVVEDLLGREILDWRAT